jgi:hypothetical protein
LKARFSAKSVSATAPNVSICVLRSMLAQGGAITIMSM